MRFVLGVTLIAGLVALSPLFAEPPYRLEGLNLGRDVFRDDSTTKGELKSLFDQESKLLAQGGRGGQGGGGAGGGRQGGGFGGGPGGQGVPPGGFGGGQGGGGHGQGGRGPGGAQGGQGQGGAGLQAAQNGVGGNMPLGMQSRPCEVMPAQLQTALNLTADQRQQLDQIQQEVDARVAKVLNDQQLQQLRQMGVQVGAANRGNRPPQNPGGQQAPPQRQQQQQQQN